MDPVAVVTEIALVPTLWKSPPVGCAWSGPSTLAGVGGSAGPGWAAVGSSLCSWGLGLSQPVSLVAAGLFQRVP